MMTTIAIQVLFLYFVLRILIELTYLLPSSLDLLKFSDKS